MRYPRVISCLVAISLNWIGISQTLADTPADRSSFEEILQRLDAAETAVESLRGQLENAQQEVSSLRDQVRSLTQQQAATEPSATVRDWIASQTPKAILDPELAKAGSTSFEAS